MKPEQMPQPAGRETPDIETASAGYARRFAGAAGRYFLEVQRDTVAAALRGLTPGTLLDVGGGHGQLAPWLADSGWQVTVSGSAPECFGRLSADPAAGAVQRIVGDLLRLPVADQAFDVALAVRLISHMEDWPGQIRELCRIARRAVVIDYPSLRSLNSLTPLLFGLKKGLEGNTRTYLSFSREQLETEFARHGFRITAHLPQFALPMVLHRAARGLAPLRWTEAALAALGVTRRFGSPVILRADRVSAAVGGEA